YAPLHTHATVGASRPFGATLGGLLGQRHCARWQGIVVAVPACPHCMDDGRFCVLSAYDMNGLPLDAGDIHRDADEDRSVSSREPSLCYRACSSFSRLGRWELWKALLLGQVLSGLLCATGVTSQLLQSQHGLEIPTVSLLLGFSLSLFLLYLLMPVVMRLSSATAANLSILSADFYSLLIGVYVFHYKFHWLYLVSFGLVIAGVALYSAKPTPLGLRRSQDSDPALSFTTGTVNGSQYGPLPVMASDGTGPLLSVSHAVSVHTFGTESSPKPNGAPSSRDEATHLMRSEENRQTLGSLPRKSFPLPRCALLSGAEPPPHPPGRSAPKSAGRSPGAFPSVAPPPFRTCPGPTNEKANVAPLCGSPDGRVRPLPGRPEVCHGGAGERQASPCGSPTSSVAQAAPASVHGTG
ncbi:hypothetical protein IscW_ISCW021891, partial [Ixodes scapularis]